MKHVIHWLGLLMFIPAFLAAQEDEVKREREFTGSGLYGFMNGGAEQFLEYGVSKLVARDVVYEGQEYTVEIYDMPTPEDAFGIYSLHVFRCQRADTLGCIDCLHFADALSGRCCLYGCLVCGRQTFEELSCPGLCQGKGRDR